MASLIVVITAIVQAVKVTKLPSRYLPLLAVVLGLAGAFAFGGADWISAGAGIVTGLSASGLYSVYKRTIINK